MLKAIFKALYLLSLPLKSTLGLSDKNLKMDFSQKGLDGFFSTQDLRCSNPFSKKLFSSFSRHFFLFLGMTIDRCALIRVVWNWNAKHFQKESVKSLALLCIFLGQTLAGSQMQDIEHSIFSITQWLLLLKNPILPFRQIQNCDCLKIAPKIYIIQFYYY